MVFSCRQPVIFLIALGLSAKAASDEVITAHEHRVQVAAPYVELRTGPGRGFPVFHVAERNEAIVLEKQRTSWVRIRTDERHSRTGWVHASEIEHTVNSDGNPVRLPGFGRNDWTDQRFSLAISGGDFGGASTVGTRLGLRATPNLDFRLTGSQVLGEFSDGWLASAAIRHTPFPQWRISPWFQLGAGVMKTKPFSTIVQANDRKDNTLSVGAGLNIYLTRRFSLFMDYRRHTVLTSRDDYEEINEWNFGINVAL